MDQKNYNGNYYASFGDLKGKTLTEVTGNVGDETMQFVADNGEAWKLHYYQDCCASCSVEDICGELSDLLESPILLAEEVSSREPDAAEKEKREKEKQEYIARNGKNSWWDSHGSETWTFYKLSTIKGSVTIRWYGSSNGYYSESATFERVGRDGS